MLKRIAAISLALALLGACIWRRSRSVLAEGEVDIIVSKANGISEMSLPEVKRVYLCDKTTWPSGKHISLIMLSRGRAERAVILNELFGMTESDYSRYFLQAAFTGKVVVPPREVSSAGMVRQLVAENPGAIGYLKKEDVDDSVKVVLRLP